MEANDSMKSTPKSKPGKGARMVKELGNHNKEVTSSSPDSQSPEALLEGLHRTRAMRQNVTNAVNDKGPATRKSLNAKALMEEALRADVVKTTQKRKKRNPPQKKETSRCASTELRKEPNRRPMSQRMKKLIKVEDPDEENEEARSVLGRKAAATKPAKNKKRPLQFGLSEDDSMEDEDRDSLPAETSAYLQAPAIRGQRHGLRSNSIGTKATVSATLDAAPQEIISPRLTTSGMSWEEKKDVIVWLLKKVNYGPYCAQVSCRQLGNLEVIERFNAEYTGFHWDVSNATIAHFSPSAKTFREFEHFLHVVEYFSGQQIGAVKVTVPKGFVHPPRRAAFTANDKTTIRAHVASVTFRHEYGGSTKTMYTIVPNAPCSVAPQSVLEAIEAHYPSLPQARSIISTESGGPSSMEGELLSSRTERIVLTSVWGPFVENLGATKPLRNTLRCADPCLSLYPSNTLHISSSNKAGINTPAFDLGSNVCGMRMTELGAYKLVYHHRGGPRIWTIVKPIDFRLLEDLVAETLCGPAADSITGDNLSAYRTQCSQFVGHKRLSKIHGDASTGIVEDPGNTLYFTLETLEAKKIEYTRFVQYPGELVILFPFAYYQYYNVGPNIVEAIAYASDRWEVFPTAGLIRQCGRGCFNGKEPQRIDLDFVKPSSRTTAGSDASIEEIVNRSRSRFLD